MLLLGTSGAIPAAEKENGNSLFCLFVLIAAGVVLFIQNLKAGIRFNWWAIFIYIPVTTSLNTVFQVLQQNGKFNETAAETWAVQ